MRMGRKIMLKLKCRYVLPIFQGDSSMEVQVSKNRVGAGFFYAKRNIVFTTRSEKKTLHEFLKKNRILLGILYIINVFTTVN